MGELGGDGKKDQEMGSEDEMAVPGMKEAWENYILGIGDGIEAKSSPAASPLSPQQL